MKTSEHLLCKAWAVLQDGNYQAGNRADEQKEIDSGRRAGVKERGIEGQPEIDRQYSKGNLARWDGHPNSGEMLDLH